MTTTFLSDPISGSDGITSRTSEWSRTFSPPIPPVPPVPPKGSGMEGGAPRDHLLLRLKAVLDELISVLPLITAPKVKEAITPYLQIKLNEFQITVKAFVDREVYGNTYREPDPIEGITSQFLSTLAAIRKPATIPQDIDRKNLLPRLAELLDEFIDPLLPEAFKSFPELMPGEARPLFTTTLRNLRSETQASLARRSRLLFQRDKLAAQGKDPFAEVLPDILEAQSPDDIGRIIKRLQKLYGEEDPPKEE